MEQRHTTKAMGSEGDAVVSPGLLCPQILAWALEKQKPRNDRGTDQRDPERVHLRKASPT